MLADDMSSSDVHALRHLNPPPIANTTWSGAMRGIAGCDWMAAYDCKTASVALPADMLTVRCCCAHHGQSSSALASCMRSPFLSAGAAGLPTRALDRLAREGAIVTRAYTPHALCAPARAALLTGRHVSVAARTRDVDQAVSALAMRGAAICKAALQCHFAF